MDFRETEGELLPLPLVESFFLADFSMTGVAIARALNASRAFNSDASIVQNSHAEFYGFGRKIYSVVFQQKIMLRRGRF